ncbi:MAG: hypothetical protein AAGD38_09100 [Acidobacteriota bacterium]
MVDDDIDDVVIVAEDVPRGAVRGVLRGVDVDLMTEISLAIGSDKSLPIGPVSFDSTGRFFFDDLAPGRWSVLVGRFPGGSIASVEVEVRPGDVTWVEIDVPLR